MRAVVQRVISSKVEVDGRVIGSIGKGLNVLLGISKEDTEEDIKYLKEKIINLRIFEDENEKLNKSLLDIGGDIIIVSQFTLYGDCRKGRRPSFIEALGGEEAYILYNKFVESIKKEVNNVATGEFGADMKVYIENDGPVTILLDSKKTF
ncbi:D-aminoacyl-tRNA deacylase [Clostridium botulinum]|uniref:D-aminoacyl-tRNA deacylase n=2 Tax=Clostridium botulinum A TaxID=36826 RepID=DTD_CLOBH|nr:D-aminoacyl-tRNA deacylase [Clostridium botulinum]A5I6D9.1 RecName: Full=D-aminoacyl-tRNA deacylase; Short=DTD; AltName: Full=Gly-tRNA(Ala) deacylase [Clostridium botulinum A str. Hall]A7FY07.1 RecName: Full=D-aminoacyl-tRNA deacylase; Short=DTD; AltName: Full=Gly-tRNA(Ala) deacylase [Clostridium botulinum A str. ATCC 19397]ABS35128.1 D-tyrosyl-tRNA(Tyr) deacylase [Clostridium botulinum A str. ATCC 19397]ABS36406.1 D-tyrosyl-tRNA(Tyr) deacylase [Clostridium botulinum A str. Hall]APQ97471.1 